MKPSDNIQEELRALGLVMIVQQSKEMPYAVPQDFFEGFAKSISTSLIISQADETSIPVAIATPMGNVPDGYFAGLATQILGKIKEEEEIDIWTKEMAYQIPKGYFDNLPANILAAVKKAELKPLPTRIPLYRAVQLAASLALVFFVGLGIFQTNQHQMSLQKNIASISDAEIAKYINDNIDDFDTDIVLNGLSFKNINEQKSSTLNSITEDEINQYMIEEGMN